jgi:Fe2+ or Zn2+ uptake regulation protein
MSTVNNDCNLAIGAGSVLEAMRTPAELTELFRARGLKVTPQRQAIFRILHGATIHPTAEAVYAEVANEMPTISLRTVYQTLNDLASMGEVQSLDLGTGSARFDPNLDVHHHLVCESCGAVHDLYADFGDVKVPAAERHGFVIESTEIVFRGRCTACSAAVQSQTTSPTTKENRTDG